MYLHHVAGFYLLLQLLDYSTSVAFFFLSLYILLRDPRSPLNRAFFFMLGTFFVWSFSLFMVHDPFATKETAALFYNIASIGWTTFASLALYSAMILSGNKSFNRLKALALIPIPIFIYLQWTGHLTGDYVLQTWGWAYHWVDTFWLFIFCLYFFVFISATFYIFYDLWQKGGTRVIRGQASILLFTGIISAVLASITDIILPLNHVHFIPNMGPSCALIFALGIIYAMTRFQFALSEKEIRAEADREIRAVKERYEQMVNNLPVGIYRNTPGPKGHFLEVNPFMISLFEADSKEQFLKINVSDLYADPAKRAEFSNKVMANGFVKDEELELKTLKGKEVWCSVTVVMKKDDGNTYFDGIINDITERKRAETQLKDSEEKMQIIFENAPDAHYLSDLKGVFLDGNKAAEMLTGYKKDALIGKSFLTLNLLPMNQIPKAAALLAKNLIGLPTGPDEFVLNKKDGASVTVEIRTNLVKIKGRTVVLGNVRDITERKKLERELRENEKKYRGLFENSQVGMYRSRIDGSAILDVNQKYCEALGYSRNEILGAQAKITWADAEKRKPFIEQLNKTGKVVDYEAELITKKGEVKTFLVSATQFPEEGILEGTIHDITERKRAEEEVRASEEKFRTLVESASDQIFMVNKDLKFMSMNAAALRLLGRKPDEVIGEPVSEVFPKETSANNVKNLEKVFNTGQNYSVEEELNFGGHLVFVSTSLSPVKDIEGKTVAVLGVVRDITELKKLDRMKDEFVSMVSHELRTPLTVIQGILANFLDGIVGEFSEKQKHYLVTMNDDVLRLSRIIDDILNLSKLEAGAMALHRRDTDIGDLAKKCADGLAGQASKKKISISVESTQNLPPLNIDPDKIEEVFINLINNAIKFTPESGKISVRISGTKELAEISVTDTGMGIEGDQIPHLFSKFFQIGRVQGPGTKGTGLGLAICREIIELHGGRIWAQSEPGKGSTFSFTLPEVPVKRKGEGADK